MANRRCPWWAISVGLGAVSMSAVALANGAIVGENPSYRFDLARNFFPDPQREAAQRAEVLAAIAELDRLAEAAQSPADLATAMVADDRAQRLFRRHDLYLFLRFAVDLREAPGLDAADELRVKLRAAREKLKRSALVHGDAWFASGAAPAGPAERYRFWYVQTKREADHLLSPPEQRVVDALEPLVSGGDYPRLVGEIGFEPVIVGARRLDPRRDRAALAADPSPDVQRAASRQLLAGYATKRDALADLLIRAVKGQNAIAKLRGHGGALDQTAFGAYVGPAQYRDLLAEVARNSALFKDWQSNVHDPFSSPLRWSPRQAAHAIARAAQTISPVYAAEFDKLLNPANGRMDLAGEGRRLPLQGAASVYPIGVSTIYMQDYQGDLLDLIILAHESGHAVQAQLMFRAKVPMAYATGPGYFTESFGRFQELVLLDHLLRSERDRARRGLLRDALAARLLSVFNSAEEAAIELALYDAIRDGKASGADDLDAATATATAAYSNTLTDRPEMRGAWMMSDGYFMAQFQELNDAYASLLAVRYYQLYRQDRADFGRKYMALLEGGYTEAPAALLSKRLGIDMSDPRFVATTLGTLRRQVDELYR